MFNLFKKESDKPAVKPNPKPRVKEEAKEVAVKVAPKTVFGKYPLGILIAPRITEKATMLQSNNQYVFEVSDNANASLIRRAVEGKYGVRVRGVNVLNQPGKKVKTGRREGWSKGFKKAIVSLEKGQTIDFT
ncbi:MAG: 50S ribosomal protein L23 [bacterium]|nr:50S ribosomal protein L23 [bacterium]